MTKRRNESSQMSREEWEQREAADDESGSPSSGGDAGFQRVTDAEIRGRTITEARTVIAVRGDAAVHSDAASPLELGAVSPPSLLELFEPTHIWITSFFKLTKVREGPDGLSGVATLEAAVGMPGMATLESVCYMRHWMELLSVAVVLDATLLQAMVEASWLQNHSSSKPITVSKLELELTVEGAQSMETALTDVFYTGPRTASDFPECEAIRQELLRRVAEAGKTQNLLQLRVPVVCTVSLSSRENPSKDSEPDFDLDSEIVIHRETDDDFYESIRTPDQVQNFFKQVVDMGQRVIQSGICQAVPWVQFTFTKMQLKLYACIPITPDVVRAAEELNQHGFVSVLDATVDPRMVHCSTNELSSYLQALSRHSPKFHVRTGYFPYESDMTTIDADGGDKKELIVKMMTALASCSRLRSVALGGSIALLAQPRNRLHYWQALLEILLAPESAADALSTREGEFCLDIRTSLKEDDALLIQQIPGLATRRRRRIDCLRLSPPSITLEAPTIAVISLVRDMQKLVMGNELDQVPAWLAPGVLRVSPKLQSIWLMRAEMPSLTVFSDPTISASSKCLEEIVLVWPRQLSQSSVTAFFTELLDPSTPLAKSLRVLTISPTFFNPFIQGSAIDSANAELLERVLCVNRRLQHIRVPIGDSGSSILRQTLLAHNGDPVWGSAIDVEERYAFLSVVKVFDALKRLDPTVIRIIFDFVTPCIKRVVSV